MQNPTQVAILIKELHKGALLEKGSRKRGNKPKKGPEGNGTLCGDCAQSSLHQTLVHATVAKGGSTYIHTPARKPTPCPH